MSEAAIQEAEYPADLQRGSALLGSISNYRLTPQQEAAQREAAERAEAEYRARGERELAERRAESERGVRQAAVHAALLIEGERATADDVLRNAEKFSAFLLGK